MSWSRDLEYSTSNSPRGSCTSELHQSENFELDNFSVPLGPWDWCIPGQIHKHTIMTCNSKLNITQGKWRDGMKSEDTETGKLINCAVKTEKTVQQAAPSIKWSNDRAESTERRTLIRISVHTVGEKRERRMPRNSLAWREAPRVGTRCAIKVDVIAEM